MHGFFDDLLQTGGAAIEAYRQNQTMPYYTPPFVPERPTLPSLQPGGEWFDFGPSTTQTLLVLGGALLVVYLLTRRRGSK